MINTVTYCPSLCNWFIFVSNIVTAKTHTAACHMKLLAKFLVADISLNSEVSMIGTLKTV